MLIPPALAFLYEHRNLLPPQGAVLDFGDQGLFDLNHALSVFPQLREKLTTANAYEQVTLLYGALGLGNRSCIDYNEQATHRLNLNFSARSNPEIENKYGLVTNQGFSEHVFNQHATFEAIHYCCKEEGLMFHVLPCQGWADGGGWGHGFYQYQPNFFRHLANANDYELIDIKLSPFSPDPFMFGYSYAEYDKVVNFHLTNQEFIAQRKLGRGIYISILVLMRMPKDKKDFISPHE
jgi:hypothetical protein